MMRFRFPYLKIILVAAFATAGCTAFARSNSSSSASPTVVVIDPGHGGFDHGGIPGQRISEKSMTLDVALRLRNLLAAQGYRVVMTRNDDTFVPLPTRVAIANSYRDAIFVCIHFNSARREGANGIETYFYSSQSLPLASAIHYYVAGGAPSPNRGVRRRGYYVLRRTRVPAVLVECGFLTNSLEGQYALNATYREKLAEEIARGIGSRSEVVRATAGSDAVAANSVPLQPFIDLTHTYDPDISHSRKHGHSSKKSKSSRKHKSHKSTGSETAKKSSSHTKKTVSRKKKPSNTED